MKNLLIIASVALLGACSNYTTGDAKHQCCADAAANGKSCCAEMGDCDMAAGSCPEGMAMMACCADAAANGKECAECGDCDEK